jgi:hypothetical protein
MRTIIPVILGSSEVRIVLAVTGNHIDHTGIQGCRSVQETIAMPHKYRVGQMVSYSPGIFRLPAHEAPYKVTMLLPSDGTENQYRIKSLSEPHERMARESQLSGT